MTDIGRKLYAQNFVLRGSLSEADWKVLLVSCVSAMGMTPVGEPHCYRYPELDPKGGEGRTIIQPMVESYLVVDTWDSHDGAYLHVASCRRFHVSDLITVFAAFKLGMDFAGNVETLHIDPEPKPYEWARAERDRHDGYEEEF